MYKLAVFDLDGTLADTIASIRYSVNKTLDGYGLSHITDAQCRQFIGEGAKVLGERALCAVGAPEDISPDDFLGRYIDIFAGCCTYEVRPFDGMIPALKELKERGVKLAVLSNKPHAQTVRVIEDVFGPDLFDAVCGQSSGFPRKPDPTGAMKLAKRFGVKPAECLYIGDSDTDMLTGTAAGMDTIGVSWGYRPPALLKEKGARLILTAPGDILKFINQKECVNGTWRV